MVIMGTERERQRERQIDKQTDRQRDRQSIQKKKITKWELDGSS